jgi:nucleoid DNA-binding protein
MTEYCILASHVLYNKQQDNQVNYQTPTDTDKEKLGNLTKRDLVMRISDETGLVQKDVFQVIQKALDYITEALAKGQDVELRNFGVFEVRLTKSRVGRNPNKPETDVVIPARATVKFKSGKLMKEQVLLLTEGLKSGSSHHHKGAK